jgi:hypothetical protein
MLPQQRVYGLTTCRSIDDDMCHRSSYARDKRTYGVLHLLGTEAKPPCILLVVTGETVVPPVIQSVHAWTPS